MKTLISWLALDYDFIPAEKTVSHRSPNVNVHKYGTIKYDRHILLSTDKELSAGTIALANAIRTEASYCEVVPKALNISDAYNFQTIIEKLDAVLKEHNIQEADILFSNGTTVMRIAWYILSSESGFQLRLIQGVIEQEDPFIGNFPAIRFSRAIPGKLTVKQGKESYSSIPKPKEKVYALAKKIAEVDDITVLINGDSGTGKEWLAKYIHNNSARSNCKFIAVNCSALSDNLLESRLFGYKKGAFTDAKDDKKGFFEEANGGIIFLDEIGDISSFMQQSLLRVLQEHKILAVGDTQERDVDVRIIAATNKNLREMIVEGNFREDLYYRLAESELILPSLSAYDADSINIMIDSFINKFSTENRTTIKLSKNVRHFLLNYKYPGNIRELEAIIKYLYVHAVDIIEMTHLPARLQIKPATDKLIDIKRSHCQKVFEKYGRNYTQAANALGIQINTLKGHLRCDL